MLSEYDLKYSFTIVYYCYCLTLNILKRLVYENFHNTSLRGCLRLSYSFG